MNRFPIQSEPLFTGLQNNEFRFNPVLSSRRASKLAMAGAISASLATIFIGTAHQAQFSHGEVILPWQFPLSALLSFFLSGLFLLIYIASTPRMFWPALAVTSVLTAGIYVLRFPIFDEWLAGAIVVGGLIAAAKGRVPRRKIRVHREWVVLFMILSGYMLLESLIGIFVHGNLKSARFSMTFGVVFALGYLLAKYDFPRPTSHQVTLLVAWTSLAYYLLYVVHGAVFFSSVHTTILEGIGFAGSGYQTATGMVAAPTALILIGRERGGRRLLGCAVLILSLLISALSDSRAGMLAVVGAMAVSPFAIGMARSFTIAFVGVVASIVIGTIAFERPEWLLDIGEAMISALNVEGGSSTYEYFGRTVTAAKGDAGRFLYVRGAVETLVQNPLLALTGAGTYGYFPVAGPYYEKVADEQGVNTAIVNYGSSLGGVVEPPRPPAMGALIAETGIFGTVLHLLCALAAVSTIVFRRSRTNKLRLFLGPNILIASTVSLALAWTYFGEIQDMILFYLLIMPFGLVHTWGNGTGTGKPEGGS